MRMSARDEKLSSHSWRRDVVGVHGFELLSSTGLSLETGGTAFWRGGREWGRVDWFTIEEGR